MLPIRCQSDCPMAVCMQKSILEQSRRQYREQQQRKHLEAAQALNAERRRCACRTFSFPLLKFVPNKLAVVTTRKPSEAIDGVVLKCCIRGFSEVYESCVRVVF